MYQHNIFLIITFKDIQKLRNPYLYTLKIEYVDTFFYFYFSLKKNIELNKAKNTIPL